MFSPVTTNDARQRGTRRSFAHHFYPLVSIPVFLGISLFVTAALMLSIVALILTAIAAVCDLDRRPLDLSFVGTEQQ